MKLHIISAALPPQLDGIGDYTARIAHELSAHAEVTILTGQGSEITPIPGIRIVPCFTAMQPASTKALVKPIIAERPDWLVLQYNPFSYGRWGLNLQLPLVMREIRRRAPATRIAIMAHELFTPVINWKFAMMTTWQRAQLFMLGRSAQCLLFSMEMYARQCARWFPDKPLIHLPVGSNMPRVAISAAEARGRLDIGEDTVVLGLFGTANPARMLPLMRQVGERVCRTGQKLMILYIGPDIAAIKEVFRGLPLLAEGPLPEAEVSRRFAAMDIHLAAFIDGISTRRGTLMAGLQHGIPTVGTSGPNTDRVLNEENGRAFLLTPVQDTEAYCDNVLKLIRQPQQRREIGIAGQRLYEEQFDWRPIATRLLMGLAKSENNG